MVEKEKPAVIEAADTVNDVVEDLALKAAGIVGDGDPEHIAGTTNEQVYVPEAQVPSRSSDPGPAGMPILEERPSKLPNKKSS